MREDWQVWLKDLKEGKDIRLNLAQLMSLVKKEKKKRLYIRVLMTQANNMLDESRKKAYLEKAADSLKFMLNKPKLAEVLYEAAGKRPEVKSVEKAQSVKLDPQIEIKKQESYIDQVYIALKNLNMRLREEIEQEKIEKLYGNICDILLAGKPSHSKLQARLKLLSPNILASEDLLSDVLCLLRGKERFDAMAYLLKDLRNNCEADNFRIINLELGQVLRFGLRDIEGAVSCFEHLTQSDPTDRQAWGELLESLEDLGDNNKLTKVLERRLGVTKGLERDMLLKYQTKLLAKVKNLNEIMRTSIAPNVHRSLNGIHQTANA